MVEGYGRSNLQSRLVLQDDKAEQALIGQAWTGKDLSVTSLEVLNKNHLPSIEADSYVDRAVILVKDGVAVSPIGIGVVIHHAPMQVLNCLSGVVYGAIHK